MNVEVDRLSSLPDALIYKILSSIDIRDVIKFSVLSSRWRYIWTSLRCLNFKCYYSEEIFSQFVNNVLSGHNNIDVSSIELINNIDLSSIELIRHGRRANPVFLKNILDYAFAHNVQQMKITSRARDRGHDFPLSLLRSQSLKNFTLTETYINGRSHLPTSTWDLPALTTLHLNEVRLYECNFTIGMCQNLKNLALNSCKVTENSEGFSITNSQLLNLTLKNVKWSVKFVHVDTPQLKTLSIENFTEEVMISAPKLTNLLLNGKYDRPIQLSAEAIRSLEKADLCFYFPNDRRMQKDARKICYLLQHLHNVKCLALNLEIVEILCASVKVISHQPSPFASLDSLKIYPAQLCPKQAPNKIILPTEVKNYLLDSSPNVTFTMGSREQYQNIEPKDGAISLDGGIVRGNDFNK